MTLLELKQVTKEYPLLSGKRYGKKKAVVNNVNLTIAKGECVALVGESGSGKTTIAKCIMRIEKITSGEILWNGQSIHSKKLSDYEFYKNIQMVLQDSSASLHPKMQIERILKEPIRNFFPNEKDWQKELIRILHLVGLDESFLKKFPDQLSGGQKQRVCIAKALAVKPELIIFDESIASLDKESQNSILEFLKMIQRQNQLSYLFITHDLQSTKQFCDRIAVMYQGEIVETLTQWEADQLTHPYSQLLFNTMPPANLEREVLEVPPSVEWHVSTAKKVNVLSN